MSPLKRLAGYLRHHLGGLAGAWAFMVVLAATSAFYAFLAGPGLEFMFSGDVKDVLYGTDGELRTLWQLLPGAWIAALETADPSRSVLFLPALLIVTALAKGIAQTGQFYLLGRIAQSILVSLRRDAFHSLMRLSPRFYDTRAHGDLLSRLTNDANIVEQAVFHGAAPLLRDSLGVIALLAFCFITTPTLALFTFITVPLAVVPLVRFAKWLKSVAKRSQNAQGEINAVAYEALAGVRVVQAFGTEAKEEARLASAAKRYFSQMVRAYFIRAVRSPTMEALGMLAVAGLIGFLGFQVQNRGVDPAEFISFFVAIVMMYDPLKKLGNTSDYLAAGASAAERIFEVIDAEPEIMDAPNAVELGPLHQAIELEGVHFHYRPDASVLRGVDLRIPVGSTVALVGATGCGKSTLAQLLPRFYDVTEGAIRIDGHDVRNVTLASLRSQISVVSQDTFLFNASVLDNIRYGSPDASNDDVTAAAIAAHADEFIERLPRGYNTVIGERGVTLSGGQRQRLAIARAILRNTPVLILDEATSALDAEVERKVQENLDAFMEERTSVVIAHRLSTIRNADAIVVLGDGEILEQGSHAELIERGGAYAKLHAMQFDEDQAPPTEPAVH